MIFNIKQDGSIYTIGESFSSKSPSEAGLKEKNIENWVAQHPEILFPNEEILIFGQSISGLSMADVLALDARGNLIIIEIKRDWSDRGTIGQLLEYAAKLSDITYEHLNKISSQCSILKEDLYSAFVKFSDNDDIDKDSIGKQQRIYIVAHDSDDNLKNIVSWLRKYQVPIEFVPYNIYVDKNNIPKFIDINGIKDSIDRYQTDKEHSWMGHMIFNTNETHSPGAFEKMFKNNVAAIYGYPTGPKNLEGSSAGDVVLAYVNGQGIRAVGKVKTGAVKKGSNIFLGKDNSQLPNEYHLDVTWEVIVSEKDAIPASEASKLGYNLPVRTVFGRLQKGILADKLEKEIRKRTNIKDQY